MGPNEPAAFIILADWQTLPALWLNKGTGGLGSLDVCCCCGFRGAVDGGAEEA